MKERFLLSSEGSLFSPAANAQITHKRKCHRTFATFIRLSLVKNVPMNRKKSVNEVLNVL